jgi:glycosyltransferase involved in cell wall biosynthesis
MQDSLCVPSITSSAYEQHGAAPPFVSVIIPHYNDLDGLTACVALLGHQTWPSDRTEIIVADNNSACGLQAVADAAPGCRIIPAPIQGAGPARNAGAAIARGEILAFIDSDCRPAPNWIEAGAYGLEGYDFIGGSVETCAADPRRPTSVEAWEIVFGFNFKRYIQVEGYTGSGNMFTRRDVFAAVGGFRAGVAEDMDWSFRARAHGFRLGYVPDAAVTHLARPGWDALLNRWRRVASEHYLSTREQPFGIWRWLAWTAAMPLSVLPHSVRVMRSRKLPDARARFGALWILMGHRLWRTGYMLRLLLTEPGG